MISCLKIFWKFKPFLVGLEYFRSFVKTMDSAFWTIILQNAKADLYQNFVFASQLIFYKFLTRYLPRQYQRNFHISHCNNYLSKKHIESKKKNWKNIFCSTHIWQACICIKTMFLDCARNFLVIYQT